jgi:hypothetical protein
MQTETPTERGPNWGRNEKQRKRFKRQRYDGVAIVEAVMRGDRPGKGEMNRTLVRLLRQERKRAWAVASNQQELREELARVERARIARFEATR